MTPYLEKLAVLRMVPEALHYAAGILRDGGLEIVGAEASPIMGDLRLIVAGPDLPEECRARHGERLREITVQMTEETYGRQQVSCVSKIDLLPVAVGMAA